MNLEKKPNKRGPGKGGVAVVWRAERARPALPDRDRWTLVNASDNDTVQPGI